jgi:hypothetical protein
VEEIIFQKNNVSGFAKCFEDKAWLRETCVLIGYFSSRELTVRIHSAQ